MQCLEVGPSLGLVKSSSLESLHNVMHHTIKRDLVNDGTENARANFMHTKDNSYQINQIEGVEQHGVDGEGLILFIQFVMFFGKGLILFIQFVKFFGKGLVYSYSLLCSLVRG